jgi:large subunit ribosomal protein L17
MRKRNPFRQLSRTPTHKMHLLRNLVTNLITHERVITTTAKAKEMRRLAEKVVTYSKLPNQLHGRRLINKIVYTDWAAAKTMYVLGPRYLMRDGGYTRVMKLSKRRAGDNADMSVIEYVDRPGEIRAARPPKIVQELGFDAALEQLTREAQEKLVIHAKKPRLEKTETDAAAATTTEETTETVVEKENHQDDNVASSAAETTTEKKKLKKKKTPRTPTKN